MLFRSFSMEMLEEGAGEIPCTWLHEQYQIWCKANGFKPMNVVHFGRSISGHVKFEARRLLVHGKRTTVYSGVKFQDGVELEQKWEDDNKSAW